MPRGAGARLNVVFEDDWVLLVVEYAAGGNLHSMCSESPIPEDRARGLFQQMLAAAEYCNGREIYHRDLKLENVVFDTPRRDTVKLTDFGVSKDSTVHSAPKTKVGTIAYMAPEVVDVSRVGTAKTYDGAADMWSLGVVLFVMCFQRYPFGFDGKKSIGGISAAAVYRRVRLGWPEGLEGCTRTRLCGGATRGCVNAAG
jgi:serine/threonine-protein kinase SRK2